MGAARAGCLLCCAKFQEQAGKVVNGTTAMIQAAQNGHVDVVGLLVRKEARMQDGKGRTALMDAARLGHTEIVKLLIPHEAKMVNNNGGAAIHSAAHYGHTEIVKLLVPFEAKMTTGDGWTSLMNAAMKGHTDIVDLMLVHEAGMRDNDGWTALHVAAFHGKTGAARLLIPHEAKLAYGDGWTALMNAAQEGHLEIAILLISHEAKMTRRDGWTALMSATRNGHLEVARLLLEHEAGFRTDNGVTAAIAAVFSCHQECFEELIANEAESEASQIAPVMASAYFGDIPDLLARRSEWAAKCVTLTALDFALLGDQSRAVRVLTSPIQFCEFFAQQNVVQFARDASDAPTLLSSHTHLLHDILHVIDLAAIYCKSELLARALLERADGAARILQVLYTPRAATLQLAFQARDDEAQIAAALGRLKYLGFSFDGKTALDLAREEDGPVRKCLDANPLKLKQVELARNEAQKEAPESKKAAWREVEAEAAFNRSLILEIRALTWSRPPAPCCVIARHSNRIGQKRLRNRCLLMDAVRFMYRVVAEMLVE